MKDLKDFTGLYHVSKPLKFELTPHWETAENLENSGLLEHDETRAEAYTEVKKFLDDQHKKFLQKVLSGVELDWEPLAEGIRRYREAAANRKKEKKDSLKAQKELENYRRIFEAGLPGNSPAMNRIAN